ncbi:MAG: glycosyltransferase [Bacteroidia bacterium]|nr:glycosyltransferase [Bacteroidia bacterium]
MSESLNIVSFDVPFPANYGGVIDVFYKLYWLKQSGVKIHLHCFTYGRQPSEELEQLCERVYYYERKTGLLKNISFDPYTVSSRKSVELEKNLLSNDYPILFEVLHTCYLLDDPRFKNRKKIYRHSNIEHEYYLELSRSEKNFVKRLYLKIEAFKLKGFEKILKHANLILAVNARDTEYFRRKFPKVKSVYLPSFHPNISVSVKEGRGDYILFHGNLGISENYEAAVWLLDKVLSKISYPSVIAGLNPPAFLEDKVSKVKGAKLRKSPNEEEMTQLIRNAQVHVLYTAQPTGLKLKLLNVLFKGRYVVCNANMVSGTGLSSNNTLLIKDHEDQLIQAIKDCFVKDFSASSVKEREDSVAHFKNQLNAQKLISEIF